MATIQLQKSASNSSPKILVVGDFRPAIHVRALFDAFISLGVETYRFAWDPYFKDYITRSPRGFFDIEWLYYRAQNKFLMGPVLSKINSDLAKYAFEVKPDLIFIHSGIYIFPKTVEALRTSGARVFGYCNDDPFGKYHPTYVWRHFIRSIPLYDHIFVYRAKNIIDYKRMGYRTVSLLRSYYVKEKDLTSSAQEANPYASDVLFVGHYEDDGRDECIKLLVERGVAVTLYGPGWIKSKYYLFLKKYLGEIEPLSGNDYTQALRGAKISLVFLSKLNNDTYTRRCFEIPASKSFMLAEYTDDLNDMFKEGEDADYFRSKEEMLKKIQLYLNNEELRRKIAQAGFDRLLRDGHEVMDRAREVLRVYKEYKNYDKKASSLFV